MAWQDLEKVAERVMDQLSWDQIHLSMLPRTGKASTGVRGPVQHAATPERRGPNGRSPQKSKENNCRVSRAGLFEERLTELGLLYRRGQHGRGSATFRHSIQRCKRLIQ